jgi:hypothetical protein
MEGLTVGTATDKATCNKVILFLISQTNSSSPEKEKFAILFHMTKRKHVAELLIKTKKRN